MDNKLTLQVKEYAYKLGADLCGIANVERFSGAPMKMHPQGLLPTAKSVIVCAIHIPDAAMELGGEKHAQIKGPYNIAFPLNERLDYLAFRIARMLDDKGYKTLGIASSNIWRFRGYKELKENFAPDISHIYSPVAAGLGELGWHGLCITPEYGPRMRFISIVTEADLTPTPVYNGEKLCDRCGECIRNCPTNAYRKEVNGTLKITVEGKDHVFANKNLWRCAWAEHFHLDLDLDIPDVVNEQVILETAKKYGFRNGSIGTCVKVCLPKHLRNYDESYSKGGPRRKRHLIPADVPVHTKLYTSLIARARNWDVDSIHFISADTLAKANIDIKSTLPDGISAILITSRYQTPADFDNKETMDHTSLFARWNNEFTELDICNYLDNHGYTGMPNCGLDHTPFRKLCNVEDGADGTFVDTSLILTSVPFEDYAETGMCALKNGDDLKAQLKAIAKEKGTDLFGIASAKTIDSITDQLRDIHRGETVFAARDKNPRLMEYDPEVTEHERTFNKTTDFVKDAKSVIVLGTHYPEGPVHHVGKPPAEAIGPYVFTQYEVKNINGHAAYSVCRALHSLGYEAVLTYNLTGNGTTIGNPRRLLNSASSNALEAVAAGIGKMTLNGAVETEEYGIHQRFVAIVTNADLESDEVKEGLSKACAGCEKCLNTCPTCALRKEALTEIDMDGKKVTYLPADINRCNWATKFSLVGEEGFAYLGSETDVPCPETITAEALKDALAQHDPLLKARPVTGEKCIINCPLGL